MGTTMTVISTINRRYLENKTKSEVIDLALWILDNKCHFEAENARLRAALEEIENHKIHFQYSKYGEPSEDNEYTIECMKDIAREALKGGPS